MPKVFNRVQLKHGPFLDSKVMELPEEEVAGLKCIVQDVLAEPTDACFAFDDPDGDWICFPREEIQSIAVIYEGSDNEG